MVFRPNSDAEFIEPYDKQATVYMLFTSKNSSKGKLPFRCSTIDREINNKILNQPNITNRSSNGIFKTMRLALSCTGEYGVDFGGTVSGALAAMNATMTRCNGVFEQELAVHMNLIANEAAIIYTNASTDPYSVATIGTGQSLSNNYVSTWNTELMNTLTTVIGNANYDIGHLFGDTGSGGSAGCIGCVCSNDPTLYPDGTPINYKGSAFTSPGGGRPIGDTFDIDFVAHEMGHQMGGNHTFTHQGEGNNAGTLCFSSQVEPGSGVTIMGYAGVTNNGTVITDIDLHSIPTYSYKSISQIQTSLASASCLSSPTIADATPVVTTPTSYTIPMGTAFMLKGTATDTDISDVLTYCWEENDLSTVTYTTTTIVTNSKAFKTKRDGPLFRTFSPAPVPTRFFPQLSKVLVGTLAVTQSNSSTEWESVYAGTANRTLNFILTVRDNHPGGGQTATGNTAVTVDISKGPFTVTSQAATGISYGGGSNQTVTWNVANTSTLSGASTVDIYLSTNVNGNSTTFPTLVASAVPNNGSAVVTIPNIASSICRFIVKATTNAFFAVNASNFTISSSLASNNFEFTNFALFPNPTTGSFTIQFYPELINDINIAVNDIQGRLIYNKSFTHSGVFSENLHLDNAQAGIYLLTIINGDRKVVKRIIIE